MQRSLAQDVLNSLRFPEFWVYSTWLDIVTRYRRSRLGLLWAIVPPALYAFGIGSFYSTLQGWDARAFIPHMALGYVVFRLVITGITEGASACSSHASFILDGRVRLTDYVFRVVARAGFYFIISSPVVIVALILGGAGEPIGLVTFLPSLLLVLLNVMWVAVLVAILAARLPDITQLVGSVLMFAFLFTPILWMAEHTPFGTLRGTIARANPLFHMVEIVRAPILGERVELLSVIYLLVMAIIGWTLAAWIYRRYAKYVPVWL